MYEKYAEQEEKCRTTSETNEVWMDCKAPLAFEKLKLAIA
jgi:hypothetical protein